MEFLDDILVLILDWELFEVFILSYPCILILASQIVDISLRSRLHIWLKSGSLLYKKQDIFQRDNIYCLLVDWKTYPIFLFSIDLRFSSKKEKCFRSLTCHHITEQKKGKKDYTMAGISYVPVRDVLIPLSWEQWPQL